MRVRRFRTAHLQAGCVISNGRQHAHTLVRLCRQAGLLAYAADIPVLVIKSKLRAHAKMWITVHTDLTGTTACNFQALLLGSAVLCCVIEAITRGRSSKLRHFQFRGAAWWTLCGRVEAAVDYDVQGVVLQTNAR